MRTPIVEIVRPMRVAAPLLIGDFCAADACGAGSQNESDAGCTVTPDDAAYRFGKLVAMQCRPRKPMSATVPCLQLCGQGRVIGCRDLADPGRQIAPRQGIGSQAGSARDN